jgi:hypothetical protein
MPLLQRDFLDKVDAATQESTELLRKNGAKMIRLYGLHMPQGYRCGDCIHLVEQNYDKTYFKCNLFRVSASATSDWRKKWPACGKFEERKQGGS